MRRLAREREEGRERKSDNGDGGSLLCVITTHATRGGSISAREYKALKIALMNPGVLNRRAVSPPKFLA